MQKLWICVCIWVWGIVWNIPNLGATHTWLSVGGGGVPTYVHYIRTYAHFCDKKLDLDPYFDRHILTICGKISWK